MGGLGGLLIQAAAHFMLSQEKFFWDNNCCCAAVGRSASYTVAEPNLLSFQPGATPGQRGGKVQKPTFLKVRVGLD